MCAVRKLSPHLRVFTIDDFVDAATLYGKVLIEERALQACLVWPTPNLNCHYDVCASDTAARLRALPSWRGAGRNHLVFDYIDAPKVRYATDEAILVKSSLPAADYRSGFDVLYPLAPMGIFQVRPPPCSFRLGGAGGAHGRGPAFCDQEALACMR